MTTSTDEYSSKFILYGTTNWTAFNLKFKLKAKDIWSFIDPKTINDDLPDLSTSEKKIAEFQKRVLQALQLLISHLHDDIIWVVSTAPDPDDPKSVWQSLSAQFGHSRLDEIKKIVLYLLPSI